MKQLNHLHSMITVKYMSPTNTKGSRVRLTTWDLSHYNNKKACHKYINYDAECGYADEVAQKYFNKVGLNPIGYNSRGPESVYLFKWNIEKLAAIFGYEKEVARD